MTYTQAGLAYDIPDSARRTLAVLEAAGFEAWVVGGWVRDALLGLPSHDVDITCSAPWRRSAEVLRASGIEVLETGTAQGTVAAIVDADPIEVTTFREEGAYSDHRHPDEVRFVTDVRRDLARRDLTINALAYHPERGLLDPFGGRADLETGTIRTVGDPARRFTEDALRVLRTVRFAARMGFRVEDKTQAALVAAAPDLAFVSQERIASELDGIVASGRMGWALMAETEVLTAAIPELAPLVGFDQRSPFHAYDVLEHTARVCRAAEAFTAGLATRELRWAALLHDIGKPATFTVDPSGRGHFAGHPMESARQAESILRRLAFSREEVAAVCALVRMHDHPMHPDTRSVRRMMGRMEHMCPGRSYTLVFSLLDLKRSDAVSKVRRVAGYAVELDEVARVVRHEVKRRVPLTVRELAVDGRDVMREMGLSPGPEVGDALDVLLHAVFEGEVDNVRDELIAYLRR